MHTSSGQAKAMGMGSSHRREAVWEFWRTCANMLDVTEPMT